MAPIVSTIDIGRAPDDVFPYVTDPSRFGEWQPGVVSGSTERSGGVPSRCTVTRKIGGSTRTATSEVIRYEPPRRWAIHGIDGPIRTDVNVSVEPLAEDPAQRSRSRVTIEIDVQGHGFGKVLAPMVRSQVRKDVPGSCQKLKERLEQGS